MPKRKYDHDQIVSLFDSGKSKSEIAKIVGCDRKTVRYELYQEGYSADTQVSNPCVICGKHSKNDEGKLCPKHAEQVYNMSALDKHPRITWQQAVEELKQNA